MHGGGSKHKHKHSESSSGAKCIYANYVGGRGGGADKGAVAKQN